MLDLDNTLIDRDEMFRRAARQFLARHNLPAIDLDWIVRLDDSGYTPRDDVAASLLARYGRSAPRPAAGVDALVTGGGSEYAAIAPATARALRDLRTAGHRTVVVTNGTVAQQTDKMIGAGLDVLVDGWVISEAVGAKKPDPAIFHAAAELADTGFAGAWIVGDRDDSDILGAHRLGLNSVWLRRGQVWKRKDFCPTRQADSVSEAVETILSVR
ncbi:HAD-superfamily hydrolase [Nocardia nova SH22a]|uniref:HAD-superfamily hydrolase n=1 Tax=Nocardia nova SH22a TaxID=1415166 RepID=W5TEZ4_9NOCA|nr:HAD family hydrolase [Nocardia nova]AHH17870.1 HAD-superfamily hydrolase [Nocardia nova SH22a]